jgi:hypothetical protein
MNKIHPLRLFCAVMLLAGLVPAAQAAIVSATTGVFGIGGSSNLVLSSDFYFADASTPFEAQFDAGPTLPSWDFPTPPGPTRVTTRDDARRSRTVANSALRPTNEV